MTADQPKSSPLGPKAAVQLTIPGMRELQQLREQLAAGGLPAPNRRTPAEDGRIAVFTAIVALLRLLRAFKARVESGEACRLVAEERPSAPGRLVLEIAIREPQP